MITSGVGGSSILGSGVGSGVISLGGGVGVRSRGGIFIGVSGAFQYVGGPRLIIVHM